ncbi:hypothetical protein VKT23_020663 [Stygiomarasmius scandens]|uniref:N-acetyltransferase domain-containing protein n=1 Tax=Marasmiellus scandens TaxID=2682957 RepID=A0ABR1IMF0_9AGAR
MTSELPPSFPPAPILVLENVVIRPFHSLDLQSMCYHANNPKVAQYTSNGFPSPYTLEFGQQWLEMKVTRIPEPMTDFAIAVDEGKTCIGGIMLKPGSDTHERSMEVGYWIGEEFWGRGIATAVIHAFVRWAFQEHMRIERLGAVVTSGNEASQRVLKKVGFVHEGTLRKHVWKNGQFRDQFMFGLLQEDIKD